MHAEYDDFGDVYDLSIQQSEIAEQNLPYYVDAYVAADGPVLELGVGTGRVAIEAAKRGATVIGIDNSVRMLDLCRRRADEAGVLDRITLQCADARDFALPEPVGLAAIPFHTICDFILVPDKIKVLKRAFEHLRPGGRLLLDHFVFDSDLAARFDNVAHLEAEYTDPETGHDRLFWACATYDWRTQIIRTVGWTDELDKRMEVTKRRYHRYQSSWITEKQMRAIFGRAGFEVEAVYGDFDLGPVDEDSAVNVWVARKPG